MQPALLAPRCLDGSQLSQQACPYRPSQYPPTGQLVTRCIPWRPLLPQVSGAPVVSDSSELIANLSISDLRALTSEHFGVLALPVAEFLAVEHQTAYIGWVGERCLC